MVSEDKRYKVMNHSRRKIFSQSINHCHRLMPHSKPPDLPSSSDAPNNKMSTHPAIATIGRKAPLGIIQVPTVQPTGEQVRVRVEWTASTPLDLHQNDGALLVKHPQVLGDGTAGTVVDVGPNVKRLKVGDKVVGFTWRSQSEKAHQQFCTAEEWLLAKVCRLYKVSVVLLC
jgi:hypothetical protein